MDCLNKYITDDFAIYNADTCELIKSFPDDSMHFEIYSPARQMLSSLNISTLSPKSCTGF